MAQMLAPANVLRDHGDASIHLERINFDRVNRTKYDALVKEVRHVFSATCLRELVNKAYESKMRMERDGLFSSMVVTVDVCKNKSSAKGLPKRYVGSAKPGTNCLPVELSFVVKEPKRLEPFVATEVNNRGTKYAGVGLRSKNIFGRGEMFYGEAKYSNEAAPLFNIIYWKPLLGWRDTSLSWHMHQCDVRIPASGFASAENGIACCLEHQTFQNFTHNVKFAMDWRQLSCLQRDAGWTLRRQSGHSLKCSLYNLIKYSSLDSQLVPTQGFLFKISQEIAGIGGDVKFLRHDLMMKRSIPLRWGFFICPTFHIAHVLPRGQSELPILDRIFMGGPTDLRGFQFHGAGSSEDGRFIGGTARVIAGVHLYRPILLPQNLFAHAFGVAGNFCPLDPSMGIGDVCKTLGGGTPRYSLGLGLVFKLFNLARLELNYVWPFTTYPMDAVQAGIQFGLGVTFL